MKTISRALVLAITVGGIAVFSVAQTAQKPAFEAASVKRNNTGENNGSFRPRGDRLFATNMTLMELIIYAFVPPEGAYMRRQIIGGPEWMDIDRFDIEAKVKGNVRSVPEEQLSLMLQALLEERFRLHAHREKRELPVYNLIVAGGGPKMSADQTPPDPRNSFATIDSDAAPSLPRGAIHMRRTPTGTILSGTSVAMPILMFLLQSQSDRIIIDKTDFKGLMDIQLRFTEFPESALFTAIQDLGLKLEPAKGPIEHVVIDSVQHPSEN